MAIDVELITVPEFARRMSVSRQAVDQALARSADRPSPAAKTSAVTLYDAEELRSWWENRTKNRWGEKRIRGVPHSAQVNVRLPEQYWDLLKSRLSPGQTVSARARQLLMESLDNGG